MSAASQSIPERFGGLSRRARSAALAAMAATAAGLLAVGCAPAPEAKRSIELTGEIRVPAGVEPTVKVNVVLYHAWSLQGELRHPLQRIESFEAAPGAFSHTFEYPEEDGEGLVVYAWADLDGDGVLCTPSYRLDPAGLTEVSGFPADRVSATVELTTPCRAADWFYPPVPTGAQAGSP